MLIHPWDAALSPAEWQEWLAKVERFGVLAVNHSDPAQAPIVVPTHFTLVGEQVLLHFARPNPVWPHLEAAAEVRLVIFGDYAYIPSYWRPGPDVPEEHGVPTTYYASVQLVCAPTIIDDPEGKAQVLEAQLADVQPEGRHAPVTPNAEPYGRMLSAIRAARLNVLRVDAKFKYDDQKPVELRERVTRNLEGRDQRLDRSAAAQQRRRVSILGEWRERRHK